MVSCCERSLTFALDGSRIAETLNTAVLASPCEFMLISNADFANAHQKESGNPLEVNLETDCLLIEKAADDLERELSLRLPRWLAAFVPPFGAPCRLLLRRSAFDPSAIGPFRDVRSPIHDWIMRAVLQGRSVIRDCDSSPISHPTGNGVDRPLLRPAEPGLKSRWLSDQIGALDIAGHVERIASPADAVALKAGLLQLHDFLDASHSQSQSVEGEGRQVAGDYWHAIMHRREPDYANAKYWHRRVGPHAIFPQLAAAAESLFDRYPGIATQWGDRLLPDGEWNPFAFVDFCQACPQAETEEASLFARQLQWVEMLLLLEATHRDVIGG